MKLEQTQAKNSYRYGWLLARIFPYIKPYLFRIFLGFLVAIPVGLLDGVTAFALKPYMDYVLGQQNFLFNLNGQEYTISYSFLATFIPFGVVLFAAVQGLLKYLNTYLTDWTSQKITIDVKSALFSRLVHMDTSFYDQNSSGIVISRYMSDPDTASRGIVEEVKAFVTNLCGAIGLIIVMLYSAWQLALVGVIILVTAFLPIALIRHIIKKTSNQGLIIGGNITTNINETYIGNRVMTSYCLQERQNKMFKDQLNESFDVAISLVKRSGWMSPIMYTIASVGIAVVLWYGTKLIITGQMTTGSFASFVTSLLLLYKPIKNMGYTLTVLQSTFVAMGRVFELFDYEPELKNKKNAIKMDDLKESIKFENVNFEYVENQLVLKNINLEIKKGETIAIVGNSGGGKSTVANLIPRFYDIKSGSIKLDGIDVRDYEMRSLREKIAMVFQDNFLFTGTIRENIMIGNPNASEEEVQMAVKSAHLQDMLIELPNGLDTELGERGTTLSGGQRQRVAIARAMIKHSPIVILDEATSALDNESEAIVQLALDNLIKNKTVFLIAHRFTTIKNANRIAVITEGEIVELGTHEELMNIPDGQYRHLYDMQFRNSEETLTV